MLEAAKRELAAFDGPPRDPTPAAPLSDRDVADLGRLAADAPALFDAPTTTHHDRKEIIRTLVARVTFLDRSAERISARITWADAAPETTVTALTDAWVRRRILEQTDQGRSVTDILAWLRRAGHTTRLGTPWSRSGVREVIGRRRRERARRPQADGDDRRHERPVFGVT